MEIERKQERFARRALFRGGGAIAGAAALEVLEQRGLQSLVEDPFGRVSPKAVTISENPRWGVSTVNTPELEAPPFQIEPGVLITDLRDMPKRLFGPFFRPTVAEASNHIIYAYGKPMLTDDPQLKLVWTSFATEVTRTSPGVRIQLSLPSPYPEGVSGPLHKADLIQEGIYGPDYKGGYSTAFDHFWNYPNILRQIQDDPNAYDARRHEELLHHDVLIHTSPTSGGRCIPTARKMVRNLVRKNRGPLDPSPRTFKAPDGAPVTLYLHDKYYLEQVDGSMQADQQVSPAAAARRLLRTGEPFYFIRNVGGALWGHAAYGVTEDGSRVLSTDWDGGDDMLVNVNNIYMAFVVQRGDITDDQIHEKSFWMNVHLPTSITHHMTRDTALPTLEEIGEWQKRRYDILPAIRLHGEGPRA